ncbi:MAG: hypothetical protein ACXVDW_14730, partial [Bacteroidia bacterium]
KDANNIYDLINSVKRSPERIGPYENISVFEALNRIGSDLVLLSGTEKLFDGVYKEIIPERIKLNMGTNPGFDFIIQTKNSNEIYGEAFNVATTFCKEKLRQAIHKLSKDWEEKNVLIAVIFINSEMKNLLDSYKNSRERELEGKVKFLRIFCETDCF